MQNTEEIWRLVDAKKDDFEALSDRVWGMPEIAYTEHRSCAEHTAMLEQQGFRVTRNVAVDRVRRQRTVPVAEVRGSVEARDGTPTRARALMAALSELPDAQREVVMLRQFAGLSPAEIAAQTGRSEGAVNGLHHRARKSLVRDLTSQGMAPVKAYRGNEDPAAG